MDYAQQLAFFANILEQKRLVTALEGNASIIDRELSSYCGLWIDGGFIQLEHDYEIIQRVEPTDDEDGFIEYRCSKCHDIYREVLPAGSPGQSAFILPHTLVPQICIGTAGSSENSGLKRKVTNNDIKG